tara:strand:- start:824 stop:1210 length:387 start_codon:yes stop_codon:yes gene_type:complete
VDLDGHFGDLVVEDIAGNVADIVVVQEDPIVEARIDSIVQAVAQIVFTKSLDLLAHNLADLLSEPVLELLEELFEHGSFPFVVQIYTSGLVSSPPRRHVNFIRGGKLLQPFYWKIWEKSFFKFQLDFP